MASIEQAALKNWLLAGLVAADFADLIPHATQRTYRPREILLEIGSPVPDLYFPDTGMISIVTADETEVGIVGREGVVGTAALLGVDNGPMQAMCQMPSSGTTVPAAIFLAVASRSPAVTRLMLAYVHTFMIQLASTAYSNNALTVEQRLARWLLMCRDREDGDDIPVTHEFLAMMLGVRRPGVTVATHMLEGNGLIKATRGRIQIRNAERLRELADGGYGSAEAEYDRVMRTDSSKGEPRASLGLAGPARLAS